MCIPLMSLKTIGLRKNLEDKDSHEGTEALSKILNLIISEAKCRVKLQEKQKVKH